MPDSLRISGSHIPHQAAFQQTEPLTPAPKARGAICSAGSPHQAHLCSAKSSIRCRVSCFVLPQTFGRVEIGVGCVG